MADDSLKLWNLGLLGVNIIDTPLHSSDGELELAQNAEPFTEQGEGGLRKRLGISAFTPDDLGAGLLAMTSIPLPDPWAPIPVTGTRLYVNTTAEGDGFNQSSIGGLSWAVVHAHPKRWGITALHLGVVCRGGAVSTDGLLTYTDNLALYAWDGVTDAAVVPVLSLGVDEIVSGLDVLESTLYLLIADTSAHTSRLLRVDGDAVADVGIAVPHEGTCLSFAFGALWIGTTENRVYRWAPADGLTEDLVMVPNGGSRLAVADLVARGSVLYALNYTEPNTVTQATNNKVVRRLGDGSWLDITPGGATAGNYGPGAVFEDVLIVARSFSTDFAGCEFHSYDGTTWTLQQDVRLIDVTAEKIVSLQVFNGACFAVMRASGLASNVRILRRPLGGVWDSVLLRQTNQEDCPDVAMGFY